MSFYLELALDLIAPVDEEERAEELQNIKEAEQSAERGDND